jgi:large subunit ribosomal protein L4
MQVKSYAGGKLGQVEVDEQALHDKSGKARVLYRTLKDALVMYAANQRQGNAHTKGRSDVAGSHKTPWKQKHTGRARAGDRKSPIWRGGGTVFGPLTRDWSYHMPAKARRVATRTALLGKLLDGEVVVADLGTFAAPSAKTARKILADLGAPRRALIVIADPDPMLWKSFRNFPGIKVRTADEVCAHDLVAASLVVAQAPALEKLTRRIGRVGGAA